MSALVSFLKSLDGVFEEVSARVDNALNSFQPRPAIIKYWNEFRSLMAAFYCHVENHIVRINRTPDENMDWGRCCRMLMKEYGPNGEKTAMELARSGLEGGINAVLRAVGRRMIEEHVDNEISSKAIHFWNGLTVDQRLAISEEYVQIYGYLLPLEMREYGGARIRVEFHKVLREHPRLMRAFKNLGRQT